MHTVSPSARSSFFMMGGGVMLVFLATGGYLFWLALEMMSLGFLGLLANSPGMGSRSPAVYFIPNSVGNLMFLMSVVTMHHGGFSYVLGMCGLALKLGVFPLHFWVLPVASKMDSSNLFVFLGPMKIGPLVGLCFINSSLTAFVWGSAAAASAGVLGVQQSNMVGVLTFSGIITSGWLLCCALVSPTLSFAVWILYTVSLGFVLWNDGISSLGVSGAFLGGLMVLGGSPAGAVFLGKWIALMGATGTLYIKVTCLVLAGLGSSVVLTAVMYMRIILSSMATRNTTQSFHNNLFFFIVAALSLGIFFSMCVF